MALADTRFENRRRKLAAAIAASRLDALLVTELIHVRYLSNFSGSNGALLLRKDLSARIATDGRYLTQIAEEVPDIEALIERQVATALLSELEGPLRVGYEADHLSASALDKLREAAGEDITLVPVSGMVEQLRLYKDPTELAQLESVAAVATEALSELIAAGELAIGRTERQVAADLEYRMRLKGSDRVSFDTIIASGPNSAKPHHGATDRVISAGDLVTIDYGAHISGFNSDCTRTFVMGHASDFATEIYEVVRAAQAAGVAAARPGVALADVDKACRDIISDAGYGEYFIHSTGHGIGLEVHEAPAAFARAEGVVEENMTLTVEPGIYIPGRGGVRIEDTLIITQGDPKSITTYPKELQIID